MQQFNSRDPFIDIVAPLAAIIGGCIMSHRHVRAAFDNINARGGAAGYRFGRMALDSEVPVQGGAGAPATGSTAGRITA